MRTLIVVGVLVLAGIIVLAQSFYVVDVTEQVIITRFGDPITVRTSPGLNVKMPFVDTAIRLDKRLLRLEAPPASMPDIDKQNLNIDSYARYRIVDSLQFFKTLKDEDTAQARLGDIVNSSLRDQIALNNRSRIIGAEAVLDANGVPAIDPDGLPIIRGTETRSEILEKVLASVKQRAADQDLGIEMLDVRLKRADFSERVQDSIFNRMRAERKRIATRFRSEGDEQDLRIRADADKRQAIILAEADRSSNETRGRGEAEAIRILAEALNQDPEFFAFRRSLEAYRVFMNAQTSVVLPADSDLFQYLQSPTGKSRSAPAK